MEKGANNKPAFQTTAEGLANEFRKAILREGFEQLQEIQGVVASAIAQGTVSAEAFEEIIATYTRLKEDGTVAFLEKIAKQYNSTPEVIISSVFQEIKKEEEKAFQGKKKASRTLLCRCLKRKEKKKKSSE